MQGKCPPESPNLFIHANSMHVKSTQSEIDNLLQIPKHRLVTTDRGIRYYGAYIWNSIPLRIRMITTKKAFKKALLTLWETKCDICFAPHLTSQTSPLRTQVWDYLFSVHMYISS